MYPEHEKLKKLDRECEGAQRVLEWLSVNHPRPVKLALKTSPFFFSPIRPQEISNAKLGSRQIGREIELLLSQDRYGIVIADNRIVEIEPDDHGI